jgi:glycosyltransferase involved in cell wall biosynthesis
MFLSVLIASRGRPAILAETLTSIRRQSRRPDEIIIAVTGPEDLPPDLGADPGVRVILAERGVMKQRNAAIRAAHPRCDAVTFFDDDVELATDYLSRAEAFWQSRHDVVMFDGHFVHPGPCERSEARRLVLEHATREDRFMQTGSAWGCNMNFRRWVLDRELFDEALDGYAWLGEYELCERIARLGVGVRYYGCCLVHLETRTGRFPDRQLGYSQLMNARYYYHKGTIVHSAWDFLINHCVKIPTINLYWLLRADRRVDRRERLIGNVLALIAMLRGVRDPQTVKSIRGRSRGIPKLSEHEMN